PGCTAVTSATVRPCNPRATTGRIDLAAPHRGRTGRGQRTHGSADHVLHHLPAAGTAPPDAAGRSYRAVPCAVDRPGCLPDRRVVGREKGPGGRAEVA